MGGTISVNGELVCCLIVVCEVRGQGQVKHWRPWISEEAGTDIKLVQTTRINKRLLAGIGVTYYPGSR